MGGLKSFLQNWTLKRAVRQGRRARRARPARERAGFLIIFPRDPALAKTFAAPLRSWLADHGDGPVRVVVPVKALEVTKKLKSGVRTISYEEADVTRSGLPVRELRRRVSETQSSVAVLLSEEYDPFLETLFALAPARLKASFHHPSRAEYASLLMQPTRGDRSRAKRLELLLDALTVFAREQVHTDATSESARRAQYTFSEERRRREGLAAEQQEAANPSTAS